jgi:hypothetical protein
MEKRATLEFQEHEEISVGESVCKKRFVEEQLEEFVMVAVVATEQLEDFVMVAVVATEEDVSETADYAGQRGLDGIAKFEVDSVEATRANHDVLETSVNRFQATLGQKDRGKDWEESEPREEFVLSDADSPHELFDALERTQMELKGRPLPEWALCDLEIEFLMLPEGCPEDAAGQKTVEMVRLVKRNVVSSLKESLVSEKHQKKTIGAELSQVQEVVTYCTVQDLVSRKCCQWLY